MSCFGEWPITLRIVIVMDASLIRTLFIIGVLLFGANPQLAQATAEPEIHISACPQHIQVTVVSANAEQYVGVIVQGEYGQTWSIPLVNSSYDGTLITDYYQGPLELNFDSQGIVSVSLADGSMIDTPFVTSDCGLFHPRMSSVRGSVFDDINGNGRRDGNEPTTFGWFKISNGGNWYVCGYAGRDGTFGVPVQAGWYDVIPVAPQGWRATAPKVHVYVGGPGHPALNVHLGLVRDKTAPLESCDLYHPIR